MFNKFIIFYFMLDLSNLSTFRHAYLYTIGYCRLILASRVVSRYLNKITSVLLKIIILYYKIFSETHISFGPLKKSSFIICNIIG
jgi:hypothetical protein